MDDEDLKEKLIGKYGYGKTFTVGSGWVKKNDLNVYWYLEEMLKGFVEEEDNRSDEEDLKDFQNGDWDVEYTFREGDTENSIEILITPGRDGQYIANQPAWVQQDVELEELKENWEIEKYLKILEEE